MKLLSDQVSEQEIAIILRELDRTVTANVPGDVVEFGCYVGTTSVHLAKYLLAYRNRRLYLYDSFAGLPEKTTADLSPAGNQFVKGELLATKRQLIINFKKANLPLPKITKGWFADLTPNQLPEKIAFAFLDGDYYQSIDDSLKLISPRLVPGSIIIVDDYANEALPGAAKATDQWLKLHPKSRLQVEASLAVITHY